MTAPHQQHTHAAPLLLALLVLGDACAVRAGYCYDYTVGGCYALPLDATPASACPSGYSEYSTETCPAGARRKCRRSQCCDGYSGSGCLTGKSTCTVKRTDIFATVVEPRIILPTDMCNYIGATDIHVTGAARAQQLIQNPGKRIHPAILAHPR